MIVIFDLDGTLIDSVGDIAGAVSELATSLGGRSLSLPDVAAMVGDGAALLVRRALDAAGLDPNTPNALAMYLEIYDRRLLDTTVPYVGVPETLLAVSRGAHLAVLTNKPLDPSRRILDALGLSSHFAAIIGGDGPLGRKPDPAGLLALSKGAGDALLVGDSPIDWQTSQNGGCSFAWARYGFGAARFDGRVPDTPYVLERPSDLIAVLDRHRHLHAGA